jgi:lipoprotein-anchoring transpeptidase ErfK/SrfK
MMQIDMLAGKRVRTWGMALVLAVAAHAATAGSAAAQFWDWGGKETAWDWGGAEGDKKVDGSGKKVVAIDKSAKPGELIVSFSDRMIYFVEKPGQAISYPIAIPREQDDWKGVMSVSQKKINPSWTPTPTMIKENPKLPSWVPGGHPMNPMGVRAMYLGSSAYRIHGTDAPWTIGQPVSKGCIRLYNKDVVDLYDRVKLGTKVIVTWDSYADGKFTPGRSPYEDAKAPAGPVKKMNARSAAVAAKKEPRSE